MRVVFVDTSALVAFFDKADQHHPAAVEKMENIKRTQLTLLLTDFVFDETITAVVKKINQKTAVKMGEFLLSSNIIEFVWLTETLKERAWEYFKKYTDKIYSFTDCTSFVLMEDRGLQHYFSFDEDFKRAGFIEFTHEVI
ncbi:type II toxin-antitoxin system VapC family toxin [Candidatus Magnetomonas plexicatena]|uniref:type II toxin-antitoxin system VapC family toxin n=1 Tax=Candidatus Magnetomonas plexicatena TaxID=2552947 RepID=UPI0011001DF5|nr:PIN domain-containing protein [Nitrospirales bacterium LBB_01]